MPRHKKTSTKTTKFVFRSAITGRFVSEDFAFANPDSTIRHTLALSSPKHSDIYKDICKGLISVRLLDLETRGGGAKDSWKNIRSGRDTT